MSIYDDVLKRIVQAYRDASNGFHASDAAKKINDAIAGFDAPFATFSTALDKAKAAGDSGPAVTEARNTLRILDAQLLVLEASIASAARSDDVKIRRNRMDQLAQLAASKVQQGADQQLLADTRNLVDRAGQDLQELSPPSQGWPPTITPDAAAVPSQPWPGTSSKS